MSSAPVAPPTSPTSPTSPALPTLPASPTSPAPDRPSLTGLAAPLLIELGLGVVVGILATALAARVSDPAAAALALSNQLAAMLVVLLRVIGAGISVVVAQCLGSGRRDQADAVARACLGASSWMGLACAAVALAGAWPAMGAMQAPADVAALAAPLLQWLAPALLLDAWNASMASVMRAHLRAREVLAVILVMHLSHLLGAVLLMPVLGLPGFALAMGLSRLIGLVLHVWLWRARLQLRPQPSDWWRLPRAELAAVLHIGLPGAAENIAWRMGFTATVAVAGSLGAQALATQAYVQQLASFAVLFTMACGLAMEILIGHLVGAGDFRRADRKVRQTLLMSISLALCINVAIALAGMRLLGLFTQDATIIRQGQQLLWLTVVLEIGRCFNVVLVNALRAAGDARFPVVAGVASMALVLGAGSGLLAHTAGLGLAGIWIAYAADEWLRGLIMWWRWRRLAWLPHARGVVRRMRLGRSEDRREGRAAQD